MRKFIYLCGMMLLSMNIMAQQRSQLEHDSLRYCHGKHYKYLEIKYDTSKIELTPGWRYDSVLSDEFDSAPINTEKWTVKHKKFQPDSIKIANNDINMGYINRPENICIQDSSLVLSITQNSENIWCQPSWGNYDSIVPRLLSGWITSKKDFRYGYIETECYLPQNHHYWPCFWTTGRNDAIVDYDEVDVFERTDTHETDYPYMIRQNCYNGAGTPHVSFLSSILTLADHDSITGRSSVFGAEILPEEVVFYINGHVTGHLKYHESLGNDWNIYTCTDIEEMIPMFFILSLTCPEFQHTVPLPIDSAAFKYMRCYKLKRGSVDTYHPTVFVPSDESTEVYPHIILGGNGCTASISTPTALWAEQDIILDKGFDLSSGTPFSARVISVPNPGTSPLYIQNCHNHNH